MSTFGQVIISRLKTVPKVPHITNHLVSTELVSCWVDCCQLSSSKGKGGKSGRLDSTWAFLSQCVVLFSLQAFLKCKETLALGSFGSTFWGRHFSFSFISCARGGVLHPSQNSKSAHKLKNMQPILPPFP